jgi:hypothetical protein
LFFFELTAPIEIKAHFTNGDGTRESLSDLRQNLFPICTHFLRMEAEHRITIIRIALTKRYNRLARFEVDTWHTDSRHPCLTSTSYDGFEILCELFAIQMTMGIDELHQL